MFGANLVITTQICDDSADKPNCLEFWVKMVKMTLKIKVNDPYFQYQLRVFQDACLVQFGDSSSNLWQVISQTG